MLFIHMSEAEIRALKNDVRFCENSAEYSGKEIN